MADCRRELSPSDTPLADLLSQTFENSGRPGWELVRKPLPGIGERSPKKRRLGVGHPVLFEHLEHIVRALAYAGIVRRLGGSIDDDCSKSSLEMLAVAP